VTEELSDSEQAFDRALYLLDAGEVEKGEALLALVVASARHSGDSTLLVRGLCVLGELLHELGRDAEAVTLLHEVVTMDSSEPDLIAYERNRARRILEADDE
jgi:hypothetical protein